ncbi:hypothetical protein NRB_22170 [Novosphingobium sp. 11B]
MGFLRSIRAKVSSANSALADVKKSWQDEILTVRETSVTQREQKLEILRESLEKERRDFEKDRLKHKTVYGLVTIAVAISAFFSGHFVASHPEIFVVEARPPEKTSDAKGVPRPDAAEPVTIRTAPATVTECTSRGIEYFKEIGSYPTLHSEAERGRSAEEVAAERCSRSLAAFGFFD